MPRNASTPESTGTSTKKRLLLAAVVLLLVGGVVVGVLGYRRLAVRRELAANRDQGYKLVAEGRYAAALVKIGPYLLAHPEDPEALYQYARARREVPLPGNRHMGDAIARLRSALVVDPSRADARRDLLDLYTRAGLSKEALELADQLAARGLGQEPEVIAARAVALARTGKPGDALKLSEQYNDLKPDDLEYETFTLGLLRQLKRPDADLLKRAESLREKHPNDPRFDLLQATAYAVIGKEAESLDWSRRAAAASKSNPAATDPAFVNLLVAQFDRAGQFGESLAALEAADSPAFRQRAIDRLWQAGRDADVLGRTKSLDPADLETDANSLGLRAAALYDSGRPADAAKVVEALGGRKEDPAAAAWAGVLSALHPAGGKAVDTAAVAEAARSAVGSSDAAFFSLALADAYAAAGEPDAAVEQYRAAARLAPAWPDPLAGLLRIQPPGGPSAADAARELARRATTAEDLGLAADALAQRLAAAKRKTDAPQVEQLADRALQQDPDDAPAVFAEALVLIQSDRAADARALVARLAAAAKLTTRPTAQGEPDPAGFLRLAALSAGQKWNLEPQLLDAADRLLGPTPGVSLQRALLVAKENDPTAGRASIDAAAKSAGPDPAGAWRVAAAEYVERTDPADAKNQWIALADALPADAAIQRRAATARSTQSDADFLRRATNRLAKVAGDEGITWRLAGAALALRANAQSPTTRQAGEEEQSLVRAASDLAAVVRRYPDQFAARTLLADVLTRLGSPKEAADALAAAADRPNAPVGILIAAAGRLQAAGDFARAKPYLDRAAADRSLDARQRRAVAGLLTRRGDRDAARSVLASGGGGDDRLEIARLDRAAGRLDDSTLSALAVSADPDALRFAAETYAASNRPDQAKAALDKLAGLQLAAGAADYALGEYASALGRREEAVSHFRAAAEAAPTNPSAWRRLVAEQLAARQFAAAAASVAEGLKRLPDDAGLRGAADGLAKLGPGADALAAKVPDAAGLVASLLGGGSSPEAKIAADAAESALAVLADAAKNDSPLGKVADALRPLAAKAPGLYPLAALSAKLDLDANRPADARATAVALRDRFPTAAEPAELAARASAAAGKWSDLADDAKLWRDRAADAGQNLQSADLALATARLRLGYPAAAAAQLRPYLDAARADPRGQFQVAYLYSQAQVDAGAGPQAADLMRPLLKDAPPIRRLWVAAANQADPAAAASMLAEVAPLETAGSLAEQMALAAAWQRVAKQSPEQSAAALAAVASRMEAPEAKASAADWEQFGMLRESAGLDPIAAYRRALSLDAKRPVSANNLAMALLRSGGDKAEAERLAKSAAATDHAARASFLDTLAEVQMAEGKPAAAAESLDRATRLEPRNPQWWVHLAEVQSAQKRPDDARATLKTVDRLIERDGLPDASLRPRLDALHAALNQSAPPK